MALNAKQHSAPMLIFEDDTFEIGCNDPKSSMGDYPPRRASVRTFKIDPHPVTNGDFASVHYIASTLNYSPDLSLFPFTSANSNERNRAT